MKCQNISSVYVRILGVDIISENYRRDRLFIKLNLYSGDPSLRIGMTVVIMALKSRFF